jgi:hypothetical protein
VGDAVGLGIFGLFSPVVGVHLYEVPPMALSCAELPLQIVVSPNVKIAGREFTVIIEVAVLEHPFAAVPVTV